MKDEKLVPGATGRNPDGVVNSPSRVRARGMTYAYGDVNGNIPLSDHARAGARARRPFAEAEVEAWRRRIFAESVEDPVKVAVGEAVRDFGRPEDFTLWAWYANRIGVNSFLELYFEQKSIMRSSRLRRPAAAFQKRLKRFYAALSGAAVPPSKGKAKTLPEFINSESMRKGGAA